MARYFAKGDRTESRRAFTALAAATMAMPLIALVGWLGGVPLLASYGGESIPMAPSTAISFVLLSLSLLMSLRQTPGPVASRSARLSSGLVFAYGARVLLEWLTGLPVNPDDLLPKDLGTLGEFAIGHMSPATGLHFVLSAASVMSLVRRSLQGLAADAWSSLVGPTGMLVLVTGAIFALGYALDTPLLYDGQIIPLALPTALSFMLLGAGLTVATQLGSPASRDWMQTLKNMRVSAQLRLGLGLIVAFIVVFGVLAVRQARALELQSKLLYDHPLPVRSAVGQLEINIGANSRHVRDLFLAPGNEDVVEQSVEVAAISSQRQLEILYARYLGPPGDLDALRDNWLDGMRFAKRPSACTRQAGPPKP